mmetsp:Transcript_33397/g.73571  ORF Transcript_33397/g.73571 Transcript_33397/m.73571 type:complete len:200 (+) Transcript_33397:391-990(+)
MTVDSEASPLLILQPSTDNSTSHSEPVAKSISNLGSYSLLINNLIGPAMLGFPHLYQQAGLVPTTLCTLFIFLCATLSGTLFSDAIGSIPGNKTFTQNVDFSSAFRLLAGDKWYYLAEALFLMTCVVQSVAAIVSCAQSIDGLLASFVLGRSYALQVAPVLAIITWTPDKCFADQQAEVEVPTEGLDCTPFSGNIVHSV